MSLVPAVSQPNSAGYGLLNQIQTGQPAGFSSVYAGSKTKSFDVSSLCYACVVNTQATLGAPIGCTIKLTGKKVGTGATVGPQLITYAPPTVLGQPAGVQTTATMTCVTVESQFKALSDFSLEIVTNSLSGLTPTQQQGVVLRVDDVIHTNYY